MYSKKNNLTVKVMSDNSGLIVILADDGFNPFRIPLTLEDAEELSSELKSVIEREKMKMKMDELNLEEHGDMTLKEMVDKVIVPDIQKEVENRIGHREPKNFDELIEILKKEHTETFKDITLEAQLDKFVDEQHEYEEADNCLNEARELADMIIVAAGVARFAPRFVKEVLKPYLRKEMGEDGRLNSIIAYMSLEKSLINKNRKWEKKGGKYQHK